MVLSEKECSLKKNERRFKRQFLVYSNAKEGRKCVGTKKRFKWWKESQSW